MLGFGVLTAVVMTVAIFWDIAPCSSHVKRRFGGTYRFHFQGRKSAELQAGFFFDPEDVGATFLRNVASYAEYTALYPRTWRHSFSERLNLHFMKLTLVCL
jgi:hypothetical protein